MRTRAPKLPSFLTAVPQSLWVVTSTHAMEMTPETLQWIELLQGLAKHRRRGFYSTTALRVTARRPVRCVALPASFDAEVYVPAHGMVPSQWRRVRDLGPRTWRAAWFVGVDVRDSAERPDAELTLDFISDLMRIGFPRTQETVLRGVHLGEAFWAKRQFAERLNFLRHYRLPEFTQHGALAHRHAVVAAA